MRALALAPRIGVGRPFSPSTPVWEPISSARGAFRAGNAVGARVLAGSSKARPGLALGLALAVLGSLAVPSFGAPSAYILDVEVLPVDLNANDLFDYLNISAILDVPQAGSYLVGVTLRWPVTGTEVAANSSLASFAAGAARYTLRIDGASIAEKQLDGPFNLTVDLLSSPSGPVRDSASFPTPLLRAKDFERPPQAGRPELEVGPSAVQLASPSINASVNLSRPSVAWGPRAAGGAAPAFEATFPSVVAFSDDGDHAYEPSELACRADTGVGPWSIAALEVGASSDLGFAIRFTLASRVRFEGPSCPTPIGANASIAFLIAERGGAVGGPTPYPLEGGLEVKVDLRLSPDGRLPGSDLAFEVALRDLWGNHSFLLRGPQGFEAVDPASANRPVTPLAPSRPLDLERIGFLDAQGAPRGHFAWLALGQETLTTGAQRTVRVAASSGLENRTLGLFLAVPNDAALESVTLDPAVGVPAAVRPPAAGDGTPEPNVEKPSLTVFVGALAAVAAMFFFSVYARAKKY